MSKERLEDIEYGINKCEKYAEIGDWEASNSYIINLYDDGHIKWLIEQAERVQELERANKQLKGNLSVYQGYYKGTLKHNKKLIEQNKRYRDLLKKIKEMTRYDDCREAEIYELVSDELEELK